MNEVFHEQRGAAFWITLNRPDKRNALNADVIEGLREGLRLAQADPRNRVIVITGAGERAFCAGGDLQPGGGFAFDLARPSLDYADLLRDAHAATLPLLARINGACMAGGMGLLAMCDFAVSIDEARFGLPEVKLGLFPLQVLSLLQSLVPPRVLREWAITGSAFKAQEALRAGLLNEIVPAAELDARIEAWVARIAANSPTAIRRGKYAMRTVEAMDFEQALSHAEGLLPLLAQTEDAREGLAAFNEKRPPMWRGR